MKLVQTFAVVNLIASGRKLHDSHRAARPDHPDRLFSRHNRFLGLLSLIILVLLPTCLFAQKKYVLTVYADEGHTTFTGHVFVDLASGDLHNVLGWYGDPKKNLLQTALGDDTPKGMVRIDSDLLKNGGYWDMAKPYEITEAGYHTALELAAHWNSDGQVWAINHHCGDFAEALARAAGVPLDGFPRAFGSRELEQLGRNRPALWGTYLREHNGSQNPQRTPGQETRQEASTPKSGPTPPESYEGKRQQLVSAMNAANAAMTACTQRQLACFRGCHNAKDLAACDAACGNCDKEKDTFWGIMKELNDLDNAHSAELQKKEY